MGDVELRPIKRAIIATGLTAESVGAVVMGEMLAERWGLDLHAAHVFEPVSEAAEQAVPGLAAAHAKHTEEELRVFVDSHGLDVKSTLHTRRGNPEREIVHIATEVDADLLVLGRYGKGGLKRGRLGSIAARIVRRSPVNVLVADPLARELPTRIGVACDFTRDSDLAVARAVWLAKSLGSSEVVLLHAYDLPAGYHTVMSGEQAKSHMIELARERAARMQARWGDAAGIKVRLVAGEGPATTVVPELASAERIDLVVINTHGRSAAAHLLLKHTTEKIINNLSCSVWAEKSPQFRQAFMQALARIVGED